MAHAIPKIEWKNVTQTGTRTGGSPIIASMLNTTGIEVGMLCEGDGIPTGATVISTTSTSVTLSVNAMAPGTTALNFLYRISFDYPPIETEGETLDSKERNTPALSGVTQTSVDYVEGKRTLEFSHVTQAIKDAYYNFFRTYAYLGQDFYYYDDKTLNTYIYVELFDLKFVPKKIAPNGSGYTWKFQMKIRRVL